MQELRARRLWSAWILSLVLEKDHDIDAVIAEYVRVWRKLDRSFDPSKTDIKVDRGVVEMLVESASGFGHSLVRSTLSLRASLTHSSPRPVCASVTAPRPRHRPTRRTVACRRSGASWRHCYCACRSS